MRFGIQPPAQNEVFVGQNNPKSGLTGDARGHKAGRSGTDDQEVAM